MASQWFASWFDSPHYHKLYGYRDESEAARFVESLVERLRPAPGADALDLGCGAGRHARQLAAQGLRVTGLDLAAGSIADARRLERPGLHFERHDMREPFGTDAFDYVFSFFTSFGYFDDPTEHRRVVSNIAASLRCSGTLVLDYLNVRHSEARQTPRETKTIDGVNYHIARWSDDRRFFKRIRIVEGLGLDPIEYVEKVAKFSLEDFRAMFSRHDLAIDEVFGDYSLNAYDDAASPRLIVVARKRGAACSARLAPRQVLPNAA
jgi:SAM-dependent methyltransferase